VVAYTGQVGILYGNGAHGPWGPAGSLTGPSEKARAFIAEELSLFQTQQNPHQKPFLEDGEECETVAEVRALLGDVGVDPMGAD